MKHYLPLFLALIYGLSIQQSLAQQAKPLYQDPSIPIDERVSDLISRMTLEEKAYQLFNQAPAIPRLGIPAYNWWNECLHGVARAGKATVFPQAIGMASTFDEPLMLRLATAISDEARAKHHYFERNNARGIYMGLTFWTPNINIFRDPRWGRGQETYGEDPYLTSRMAVSFIKGLQGDNPKYFKTIATAKHYAVHSGPEFTRHSDNIFVNDRDLYETYLPAFRAAVTEANVQSVMCAYNRFRDQPCCGSDFLLKDILRNELKFNGYIVSDCGAITDFYNQTAHHVVSKAEQAWGWSLNSGTDLNCEENKWFVQKIDSAVNAGIISERDINISLARLLKARFQLGMFDPQEKQDYAKIPMSVVGSSSHLNLALQAAEKSFVLLKNDGILPLKKGTHIALIGPNANNPAILIGNYNGDPVNPVTPLKGLKQYPGVQKISYSPGSPLVPGLYTDFAMIGADQLFHTENGKLKKGLKASYYGTTDFSGKPGIERLDPTIDFKWEKSPVNNLVDAPFSVRWEGILVPSKSGLYQFSTNLNLTIDEMQVLDKPVQLQKGNRYKLTAELVVSAFWWASNYQQAYAHLLWTDTSRDYFSDAMDIARSSDIIVFCGGISSNLEGEEMKIETDGFAHGDRTNLNLPPIQRKLLSELKNTGKPIIYINFSGSAVALNWEQENVSAILQGFYPGEGTGTALARILFGDVNPSGRLPVTFYKSVDDLPAFSDYQMKGRTYRYYEGQPLYEFGYGLSYTSFRYSELKIPTTIPSGEPVPVIVSVTNTGKRVGEEVVQIYISHIDSKTPVPQRSLVAFKRVSLNPGETKTVELTIRPDQLSKININNQRIVEAGTIKLFAGGKQPDSKSNEKVGVEKIFTVTGEIHVLE